jgi:hypothetical protein
MLFAPAVFSFVFLSLQFLSASEVSRDSAPQPRLGLTSRRSTSGHFVIVGSNESANMELAAWADNLADRLEKLIGLRIPYDNRIFRIVVNDNVDGDAAVNATQQFDGHAFVQRLVINGYTNAVKDDAEDVFCRLLLNCYVVERTVPPDDDDARRIPNVPQWLSYGVVQNLHPSARARNTSYVLQKWQHAQLDSLVDFLGSAGDGDAASVDRPMAGIFTAWLLALPDKQRRFDGIFQRLADDKAVTQDWLVTCIPDCNSVADFNEKWDDWMLKQERIVFQPGKVSPESMNQLQAELLLYRGECGIPLRSNVCERIGYRDLIDEHESGWIPGFVESKCASLRFLTVGRGDEFSGVVESYCRFLAALTQKKSRKQMEQLLDKAKGDLDALEKKIANER